MSGKANIFANIPHQLSSAFLLAALSAGMVFGHPGHESPHSRREEDLMEKGTELVEASPVARGNARTYNLGGLGTERAV